VFNAGPNTFYVNFPELRSRLVCQGAFPGIAGCPSPWTQPLGPDPGIYIDSAIEYRD
jgi:hypothetical protein